MRYSPDGKRLVVGDEHGVVQVFDATTGSVVRVFPTFGKEVDTAMPLYSPGGELLAVVTSRGGFGVWDAEKGDQPRWVLPPDDSDVRHIAFSPDGKVLAGAEEWGKRRVRLWEATTGTELRALPEHPKSITGLAFSPDGKRLATSCEEGGIRLFDPATGKELKQLHKPDYHAAAVAWSPDGKTLAWVGGGEGEPASVVFWDVATEKEIARGETRGNVRELVFTPDGRLALGDGGDGTQVWDAKTGKEIHFLRWVGGIGDHPSLAVTPDSKTLATPNRHGVLFTDLTTGKRIERFPGPQTNVSAIAYTPSGKTLAAGTGDGRVYIYDLATGELRRELPGENEYDGVRSLAFSPDGKTLAVAAGRSKFVRLWDVASGEVVRKFSHPDKGGGCALAIAFSPDGKILAFTNLGIIRLYDPATGTQLAELGNWQSGTVNAIAFSPDGKLLAAVGGGKIRLWDVATSKEVSIWHFHHTSEIKSVAFSPDGKRLVWGAAGGWCQVWEVESGRTLARIRGHEYAVESVAFTPDGKRVVTAGTWDTGPRVWDADTGKELIGFRGHFDNPEMVVVAPDGKTVASAGEDGQVLIWDLNTPAAGTKPIGPPPVRGNIAEIPKGADRLGAANSAGGHVAFSSDSKQLAATLLVTGSEAGLVVWDVATRRSVWQIENDRDRVFQLFWLADGSAVVTISDVDGGTTLTLWDAATGKELKRVRGLPSIAEYALSPDGKTLAARHHMVNWPSGRGPGPGKLERTGGEIDLLEVTTGKRVRRLEGHDGDSIAWSPDGKSLVSGSARNGTIHTIRVWDPATGKVVREWDSGQGATPWLQFLPDGTLMSGPGEHGTIRFWDINSGKLLRESRAAGGPAVQQAVSADGKRVAQLSFVSPVEVSDTKTGKRLGEYRGGERWYGFALSPDGQTLATSGNGNLLLWPVPLRGEDD